MILLWSLWLLRYVIGVWHSYCDVVALIDKLRWFICACTYICYVNNCRFDNGSVIKEIVCLVSVKSLEIQLSMGKSEGRSCCVLKFCYKKLDDLSLWFSLWFLSFWSCVI